MANSLKQTTFLLFILRLLRMMITVVTVTFSAKYFGVSMEKDIWVLTLTIITTVTSAVWGPVNEVFRTKFVFIKEQEGAEVAVGKTASLVGFVFWVTILLTIGIYVAAPYMSQQMTHNMQTGAAVLFVNLLLLQLPCLMINELTNIGISILNAYNVYFLPEIVGFASGLINLAAIILFADNIGIYSLLIGTYFGIMVLFGVVLFFLQKKKIAIWGKFISFKWMEIKVFLFFALPFFFPYFVGQINTLFEKYLAGMLGSGNISSVEYARQFITVLQNVSSSVLTTIMVPVLAKQFINHYKVDFNRTILDNLMICMFIYWAASIFLIGSAPPLCDFFFNRGKVSPEALDTIVELTKLYGVAFFGVLIYLVTGLTLLASDKGKIYAAVGVGTQIAVLAINLLFSPYYGVYVFPVALGTVHFIAGVIMFSQIGIIDIKVTLRYLLRALLSVAGVTAFIYVFNSVVTYEDSFERLVVVGVMFLVLSPFVAWMLGFDVRAYYMKIKSKCNHIR